MSGCCCWIQSNFYFHANWSYENVLFLFQCGENRDTKYRKISLKKVIHRDSCRLKVSHFRSSRCFSILALSIIYDPRITPLIIFHIQPKWWGSRNGTVKTNLTSNDPWTRSWCGLRTNGGRSWRPVRICTIQTYRRYSVCITSNYLFAIIEKH